jgi:hypothetical protein
MSRVQQVTIDDASPHSLEHDLLQHPYDNSTFIERSEAVLFKSYSTEKESARKQPERYINVN